MVELTISLPDDVLASLKDAAAEDGKTLDQFVVGILKRSILQRTLARIRKKAEAESEGMSEEEIERVVERAIAESRAELRATSSEQAAESREIAP